MLKPLPACLEPPADNPKWSPPLDVYDTVVRLETAGITDAVAQQQYECASSFQLAELCLPVTLSRQTAAKPEKRLAVLVEYLKGISFSFSLLICCLSMVVFHASLWGGDLSANMAAAVGLGTVSSFITTGGLVQAMARRGLFLIGVRDGVTAEAACWRWVRLGVVSLLGTGVCMIALSRFYGWLPSPYDLTAFAFHVSLGLLWLATGMLQMLDRNLWSAAATALGASLVLWLHLGWSIELVAAQVLGILVAAFFAFCVGGYFLHRTRDGQRSRPRSISPAFDAYITWPYFVFGTAYYVLVFVDRLLAWTAPDLGAASSVRFRGDYETALDLALFGFVIQVGRVRSSTAVFFRDLTQEQKEAGTDQRGAFTSRVRAIYKRLSWQFAIAAAVVSVALFAVVSLAKLSLPEPAQGSFFAATLGFSALVFALWNTSLLIRLANTVDVLRPILTAILVDVAIGYLLTRIGSYHYAAWGFAAGAICYAALSCRVVLRRLQSADYHLFVAGA